MSALDWVTQAWHWSFSGLAIAFIMFLMMYYGERFGVSTSFQTLCSIGGAKRWSDYFQIDWKKHDWLLIFIVGAVVGGAISSQFLDTHEPLVLASETIQDLSELGIAAPKAGAILPDELFIIPGEGIYARLSLLILGGFLVGFGARYAGGCTSGHAISGLSNLQLPSLLAVVGFFIGGLLMTHLFFPFLLQF